MSNRGKFLWALFLTSASTLMLQIIQTRILSVVAWYHLAFFAISMAMFGITAGAVWVHFQKEKFTEISLAHDLSYYGYLFSLSIVISLIVQMSLAPVITRSLTAVIVWIEISSCLAIPFIFSGVIVSLALTRSPFPIGKVYAWDLFGAAFGCIGVYFLLNMVDGPTAVLWVSVIAFLAALLFSKIEIGELPEKQPRFSLFLNEHKLVILGLLVCVSALNGITNYGIQPLVVKGSFEGGDTFRKKYWNTFSRVAVSNTASDYSPSLWGASPALRKHKAIDQRKLNIDGDAATVAYRFQGDLEDLSFLGNDVTNLAYHLPNRMKAAVIGVGGGRDILSAAHLGVKEIVGIEINPTFIDLLTKDPEFSNFTKINSIEGVRLIVDEGRSWFARSEEAFDVIQMALIDTWAATGAGAFSLSENGLYTIEAWELFIRHLTPSGVFTVSRWFQPSIHGETGRMLSLAVGSLLRLGIKDPNQHIYLVNQRNVSTILVSRNPFDRATLDHLAEIVKRYRHFTMLAPGIASKSLVLNRIVASKSYAQLISISEGFAFDLFPPTDDRPFFFNQLKFSNPLKILEIMGTYVGKDKAKGGVRAGNLVATATLMILLGISIVFVLLIIILPVVKTTELRGKDLVMHFSLYFMLIGAGFMFIEIALLQKLSIYLGHPTHSLIVLLSSLILSTGLGSYFSDNFGLNSFRRFVIWCVVLASYLVGIAYLSNSLLSEFSASVLWVRVAVCLLLVVPAGFLMGNAFPTGMSLATQLFPDDSPTAWLWGINGAMGVLASTLAIISNIAFGITMTIIIGSICYLLLIPLAFQIYQRKAV